MSILEIELNLETRQRLSQMAARRGLPTSEMVQADVEKLLEAEKVADRLKRSMMEMNGLGAEIWKDGNGELTDAQAYVNTLRSKLEI
jgi:hypothetical protein